VGFRVFYSTNSQENAALMKRTYFVYLDEFGHVGPFISRTHSQHNTFPIFGFGGIIIPAEEARAFSSWFFQLKCNLLAWEIERSGVPPFRWEKKGAALYTTNNVLQYRELRQATFRLLTKIRKCGGYVFYVGLEKNALPDIHQPNNMMFAVLREAIKRLDAFCTETNANFLMFIDHREEITLREAVVGVTQKTMYGADAIKTLLEAPTQVESHLYQSMQAADWICGLLGRIESYRILPSQYTDYDWTAKYFANRLHTAAIRSGVRKQANLPSINSVSV
jgi:hypothetical protein